jgi:hypothetical protein
MVDKSGVRKRTTMTTATPTAHHHQASPKQAHEGEEVHKIATEAEFSDDLLRKAEEIAKFLRVSTRYVHHLVSTTNLPVFKMGGITCARKSVLIKYFEEQENRRRASTKRPAAKSFSPNESK